MDKCCRFFLISGFTLFSYICYARSQFASISVIGPVFVNREVTLKMTPFYPWRCEVEWKYILKGGTHFQTIKGPHVKIYSKDASFFLKWNASIQYNNSEFYAKCSTNITIRTRLISLTMKERPSNLVIGPKSIDFNITECIHVYEGSVVYCLTDNGTQPIQVVLIIGQDSVVLAESERNKGMYRFHNVHQRMAGLSRRNVTCQFSYAAIETPYEVHGILCSVEKGIQPVLTVPEFLDGEISTAICEVHNAFPAPTIEIHIGDVLLADAQQTNSFNRSTHTFSSTAKVTMTNETWNGKVMCCRKNSSIYDFGLKDASVCKNISMKCDLYLNATSPVDLPLNITVTVNCLVNDCISKGQWTLWWENKNNTVIKTCHQTEECLLTLNNTEDGGMTYICNAFKSKEILRISLTVLNSMTEETTTNPALVATKKWFTSVLYAVSGTIIVLLVTTFTLILFKRWKPHVYETLLRRRKPAERERSTPVYDEIQSSIETTALHNLTGLSAGATEIEDAPPLLDMKENKTRTNENVSNYDYVKTASDHRDRQIIAPDANYIHAI